MKKLIALLLAAVLVLSMAACSKKPSETTGSTEPTKDLTKLDELYWRDSYSGSDAEVAAARDTVVGFIDEAELTNGMLQIYYWMDVYNFLNSNGYYLALYGLTLEKPLDSQSCVNTDGTWQHYFLQSALDAWRCYQSLALMAEETDTPMDPDLQKDLDGLMDLLAKQAKDGGYENADAMMQAEAGAGCTAQDYYDYTEMYYRGFSYFNKMCDQIEVTDAMIEQYFNKYQSELAQDGITKDSGSGHKVRHILVKVEGGTKDDNGKTTYSDTEWDACRVKAQKLLDQWLAGEHTEDTFAQLANEHSEDPGSNTAGGLYAGLTKDTNFVDEFKDWYLAEGRQIGDYGLIKTEHGYHIMYYSGTEPQWITACREGVKNELTNKIITDATNKYTTMVVYDSILLGEVDLNKDQSK